MHFYGAPDRFPKMPGAVYDTCIATPEDYAAEMRRIGVQKFVAIQSVTYGFDNSCLLRGMAETGSIARGVAVVAPTISDTDLQGLHDKGIRGVRAFMLPGGAYAWEDLPRLAGRIEEMGWHLGVQFNGRELSDRAAFLSGLAAPVVLDHVGKFMPPVPPNDPALGSLLRLLETGQFWVKISAPYESSETGPPDYSDIRTMARSLVLHAPERLVWGSNWPHTAQADPPDNAELASMFLKWVTSDADRRAILCDNPVKLYDF